MSILGKRDCDDILQAEKSKGLIVGTTNAGGISKKPKVDKPYVFAEGRENKNIINNVQQDYELNKKDIVIPANTDAREIAAESGFEFHDNKNHALQQHLHADSDTVEENKKPSSYSSLKTRDFMKLPVFAGEFEYNGKARISSEKDLGIAFNEVTNKEQKIWLWQQIDAMRKIVGYKAVKQATYFEELKALYLFTGVEPPVSKMEDPYDLLQNKK